MTDPASSEEEMHDIEWPEEDTNKYSQYDDPNYTSPQITAVILNNVPRMKVILSSGRSVNINDSSGNTPLHVAIIENKREMFHFLVNRKDIRLDAANFAGMTPLMVAIECRQREYARKLIHRGVELNSKANTGDTALHFAVKTDLGLVKYLLEKGAPINEQNANGETPLLKACSSGHLEMIHMLLYYGADATIACFDHHVLPLTYTLKRCSVETQEILFEYTFGEDPIDVGLQNFSIAMALKSPCFYKMIDKTSDVIYCDKDLDLFNLKMSSFSPEMFQVFIDKFGYVVEELFRLHNPLRRCLNHFFVFRPTKPDFSGIFYTLSECPFIEHAVRSYVPVKPGLIKSLLGRNVTEDALTKVVCCLLSRGIPIFAEDLNLVYRRFGYCNLFKIMLHMEIGDNGRRKEKSEIEKFLMPMLIYDFDLRLEDIESEVFQCMRKTCLKQLLRLFVLPQGKLGDRVKDLNVPQMPSLVQLSRDAARKHIIQRYKIKNFGQFYAVLQKLPLAKTYKDILTYERNLYW